MLAIEPESVESLVDAISRRDAQERVARIATEIPSDPDHGQRTAERILLRARECGDAVLAHEILAAAATYGWSDLIRSCSATSPELGA